MKYKASILPREEHNPWKVSAADFPSAGTAADKFRFLLNYAVLAPSSRNSQPWTWRQDGDVLQLFADSSRALNATDKSEREVLIACGAALRFLIVAVNYFGYEARVTRFPEAKNSRYLARIEFGRWREPRPGDDQLFYALTQRHTNRGLFDNRPLPQDLLSDIQKEATAYGVWLKVAVERKQREELVDLIAQGDLQQWADEPFKVEMANWIRGGKEGATDGMPVNALGYSEMEQRVLPTAMKIPIVAKLLRLEDIQAGRSWQLAGGAPALAVLGTEPNSDSSRDRLAVGEALAGTLLRCAASGVAASFFDGPVQLHHLWPRIYRVIEHKGYIHLIFRLGYPLEPPVVSPRRTVSEVLEG